MNLHIRVLALVLCLIMVLGMLPATAFAAQEIEGLELGPNVIKDPDSPTGYTVKFLYENKSASQVTFAGDIALRNDLDWSDSKIYSPFEYEPGLMRSGTFTAPMTEIEDGLWYYEVPLAAGANQYWFYVDGNTNHMVADPANAPIWSPGSPDTKDAYNAVYVPYDEKQDYEPMKAREAENPRETEKGTWSYVSMEFGGQTHYMGVYLPYGYDENRPEPYKTIYVLHGYGQDESDWMGIGSVQNIMDNLAAEGRTEPAVIVSVTSDNNFLGSGGGFFGGGSYENVEGKLIPFIEENYNVSTKAIDRSWTGLSMGSMNTQNMINANAPLFGYYSAFSGGVSVRTTTAGLDQTHIFFATGWDDATVRPDSTAWLPLKEAGYYVDYLEITAAHDFNAWCQLFRIYLEDYLWQPEAFGDTAGSGEEPMPPPDCEHEYEAIVTAPTCTEAGYTTYACTKCGESYIADEVEALGHAYEDVVIAPTCTQQGYTTQRCTSCGTTLPIFGNITPALGHTYDKVVTAPTCTEAGYTTYTCSTCGYSYTDDAVASIDHTLDEGVVTKEATELEEGIITYTCTVCGITKLDSIPMKDHTHIYHITQTFEATCKEGGYTLYTCACGATYTGDETKPIGHKWDGGKVTTEPTEDAEGVRTFTCGNCGETRTEPIPPKAHEHSYTVTEEKEVTCTEDGYTTYTCACGDSYKENVVTAPGHDWDEGEILSEPKPTGEPGSIRLTCLVCGETEIREIPVFGCPHPSFTAVITAPTCTEAGYTTYICTRCGIDEYTDNEVAPLGHEFKDGLCTRCGAFDPENHDCVAKAFSDVPPVTDWAHEGIDYCVENKLMNGTGSDKFNPKGTLTRAELVTILYRLEDCPKVYYKGIFRDVPEGQWYTDAVEWAYANGIVNGVGDGTNFAPSATITREQIATILYRYAGEPEAEYCLGGYRDETKVNSFAVDAMCWAKENSIITGIQAEGGFWLKPQDSATREQIAAIMMRYLKQLPPAADPCTHEYTQIATTEATCVMAGSNIYTCILCDDFYTEETAPATGHDFVDGVCACCGVVDPD